MQEERRRIQDKRRSDQKEIRQLRHREQLQKSEEKLYQSEIEKNDLQGS